MYIGLRGSSKNSDYTTTPTPTECHPGAVAIAGIEGNNHHLDVEDQTVQTTTG
jgi:hypothetical protein